MPYPTDEDYDNLQLDIVSIGEFANDPAAMVTPRAGGDYPNIRKIISDAEALLASADIGTSAAAEINANLNKLKRALSIYTQQRVGIDTTPVLGSSSTTGRSWHLAEIVTLLSFPNKVYIFSRAASAVDWTIQTLNADGTISGSMVLSVQPGLNVFSYDEDATTPLPNSVPTVPAGGSSVVYENGNSATHSATGVGSATTEYKTGLNAAAGGWTSIANVYLQIAIEYRSVEEELAVTNDIIIDLQNQIDSLLANQSSLIEKISDSFGEPHSRALGDGTSGILTSVLTFKTPALLRDNKLIGLRLHPRATGTVKVGAASSIIGSGPVAINGVFRGQLSVAADTNSEQTLYFDNPIQYYAGEFVQLYGPSIIGLQAADSSNPITTGGYWTISDENWTTASTTTAGVSRIMVEFIFEDDIAITQDILLAGQGASTLSLKNVDKIVVVSNSYHESKATLIGKSPSCIASALTEYNWGNVSLGGQDCAAMAAIVANNTVRFGATFAQLRPTFALLSEQQNSKITNGLDDPTYYRNVQRLIDSVRGKGAEPILISEWGVGVDTGVPPAAISVDGEQRNVKGLRAIADANNIVFIDGTSKSRTMNPSAYGDFWKSAHPATRMAYVISDAIIKGLSQLPRPRKSMKIFRVRGTVTVSSAADLVFTSIQERHRLFKELYIGHSPLSETGKYYYDTATANGFDNVNQNDEYYSLQSGNAITLGTYALIDCVLEYSQAKDVKLNLFDASITVYALTKTNTGVSWVQLSIDADGLYEVPNDSGFVSYDKIRFLLYKSGGISLSKSPEVKNNSGSKKERFWSKLPDNPKGNELLTQPLTVVSGAIPAQWTNAGSLTVAALIDGAAYLPGGNQTPPLTTGAVTVTSSNGLDQPINLVVTDDPVEIVIRVWARRWVAKFVNTSSWSTAPINEETCDTATLKATLHGASGIDKASAVLKAQVGLAWTEVEFRTTFPAYSAARQIDIRSNDLDIQIAKVSVKTA